LPPAIEKCGGSNCSLPPRFCRLYIICVGLCSVWTGHVRRRLCGSLFVSEQRHVRRGYWPVSLCRRLDRLPLPTPYATHRKLYNTIDAIAYGADTDLLSEMANTCHCVHSLLPPVRSCNHYSLRQTVHTHCASVHQASKLVAALLRVAGVAAGLAESNGRLPPGL